jgi:hypothetical protein
MHVFTHHLFCVGGPGMMDLVAWHVDPDEDQAGFTPHRDRHLGLEELNAAKVVGIFSRGGGGTAPLPAHMCCGRDQ